jgi:hypothetical protein
MDPEAISKTMVGSSTVEPTPDEKKGRLLTHTIFKQFALRILFYEPTLYLKCIGKVSFEDLILSEEFTFEDVAHFILLFQKRLRIALLWLKDSVVEALTVIHGTAGTLANVGDPSEF